MSMIEVDVRPEDVALAIETSRERWSKKGGWPLDFAVGSQTEQGVVVTGLLGEIAYARYWGVPIDHRVLSRGIGDGGVDLVIGNVTVDVKSTRLGKGRLILTDWPTSLYVAFAIVGEAKVGLAGMMSTAEFRCKARHRDFGYGPRMFVEQHELQEPTGIHL